MFHFGNDTWGVNHVINSYASTRNLRPDLFEVFRLLNRLSECSDWYIGEWSFGYWESPTGYMGRTGSVHQSSGRISKSLEARPDPLRSTPHSPYRNMEPSESLEALKARHRKEQRDLIGRITQKKKSATKKTRKGVNDECERLEQELKERQAQELAALNGEGVEDQPDEQEESQPEDGDSTASGVEKAVESLSISSSTANTPDQPQAQAPNGQKKKPNRAKARLARRAAEQEALAAQAAEEAANLPDQRQQERTKMQELFKQHGLQEKEIRADGHCLYAAIADQMSISGLSLKPKIEPKIKSEDAELPPYKAVRHAAADFIALCPDDFVGFMEEPLDQYLRKIRDTGEWGGHMELQALAKAYGVKINVLHADGRIDKIEPEQGSSLGEGKQIWLGYYRHGFGLGEHYNSLRKVP